MINLLEPAPKNVITCTICTDIIMFVDQSLTNNATEEAIEEVLGYFCDALVGMEEDCHHFVHEWLPIIINLLVEEYLDPNEICEMIQLCP